MKTKGTLGETLDAITKFERINSKKMIRTGLVKINGNLARNEDEICKLGDRISILKKEGWKTFIIWP